MRTVLFTRGILSLVVFRVSLLSLLISLEVLVVAFLLLFCSCPLSFMVVISLLVSGTVIFLVLMISSSRERGRGKTLSVFT